MQSTEWIRRAVTVCFAASLAGCSGSGSTQNPSAAPVASPSRQAPSGAEQGPVPAAPLSRPASGAPRAAAAPDAPRIVCLGDSLTAGYGLPSPEEAYPALLERKLADHGLRYQVINAGVSGDTSAGGLRRLDWSLRGDVRVLIVALGGNDALRGLPPTELAENLDGIVSKAEARRIRVLLLGMEAPPNFGDRYTHEFRAVYRDLARKHHLPFIPFFLNGVAGIDSLNQGDGIHPTAEGQQKIADLVWPVLKPLVASTPTS